MSSRMIDRMKSRVTLSLEPDIAAHLSGRAAEAAGGNVSAYVAKLVMADALKDSVARHARWFAGRPDYVEAAEIERYSK